MSINPRIHKVPTGWEVIVNGLTRPCASFAEAHKVLQGYLHYRRYFRAMRLREEEKIKTEKRIASVMLDARRRGRNIDIEELKPDSICPYSRCRSEVTHEVAGMRFCKWHAKNAQHLLGAAECTKL